MNWFQFSVTKVGEDFLDGWLVPAAYEPTLRENSRKLSEDCYDFPDAFAVWSGYVAAADDSEAWDKVENFHRFTKDDWKEYVAGWTSG